MQHITRQLVIGLLYNWVAIGYNWVTIGYWVIGLLYNWALHKLMLPVMGANLNQPVGLTSDT